jgi:aminoglycoside phosphotransferase (APT) family kinase protein
METAILQHFGLAPADRLGSGWESRIYALGTSRILRIPNADPGAEVVLRAQAEFTAGLPPMPFALPVVRDIGYHEGTLYSIEDRIPGRSMAEILPELDGERRRTALAAYLAVAEAMVAMRTEGDYGDLLLAQPLKRAHWGEYLAARLQGFADNAALASDIPDLEAIVGRLTARLLALPDPEKCVVHGDIWPPNVMMDDDLRVTGLIDFSFTTRVGDSVMDLAGAVYFLQIANPQGPEDNAFLMDLIEARHGPAVRDRFGLYAVWFAFSFAFNPEMTVVYAWCLDLIRQFGLDSAA